MIRSGLNQPQNVYYWVEIIETQELTWTLTVASTDQGLFWVGLGEPETEENQLEAYINRWCPRASLIKRRASNAQVLAQLKEYFWGQRQEFTLPLHQLGTPFQLRVWEELCNIPYGETCSYGDIALRLGNPKAQRAVGMANHKNPIGIIVPCHRVIGKSGELTGYAGGIHLKEHLLRLEKQHSSKVYRPDIIMN